MFTKPLIQRSISTLEMGRDLDSINRLLLAAAISPKFCAKLLADPSPAVQNGFGGEEFPLSSNALALVTSIQASSLPEFARQLNEAFSSILCTG